MTKVYPFSMKGKITYNPQRARRVNNSRWWCTLEFPSFELADYYRWHIDRNWWLADDQTMKRQYSRPSHSPHVTIVRGEVPKKNHKDWKKFLKDKEVEFQYSVNVRQTTMEMDGKDHFWFLDTYFKEFYEIREHFGLPVEKDGFMFNSHVTIARVF